MAVTSARRRIQRWLDAQLPRRRLRQAALLTPAFFLIAVWILALSTNAVLTRNGLAAMLGWALLIAFGMAYSLVLFLSEWGRERGRKTAANASALPPAPHRPPMPGGSRRKVHSLRRG